MNMKKIVTLVMALVLLLGCGAEAAVSSTGSANTVGSTDASGEKEKQDERYVKLPAVMEARKIISRISVMRSCLVIITLITT